MRCEYRALPGQMCGAVRGVGRGYQVSPPALDMRVAWFAVLVVGIRRWLDVML